MDLLSFSSSTATSQFSSKKPTLSHHHHQNPTSFFPFSFKHITPSSPKLSPLKTSLKSSKTLTPIPQLAAPQTPANSMRGAETDAMSLLLRERIVFLGTLCPCRFAFNATMHSATMAIYDVVRLVRADVSTAALGIAASTASIILGGGMKGKRFAMPNTRIMIHQPLGGASGQAINVEIQARELCKTRKM
ncbi:hypothetical protein Peur_003157 [Populus x canadensis]